MNLLNSIWFLIAVILNIPLSLWLVTWMSPVSALFTGINTLTYYTFQISFFILIFSFVFIVPTLVLFGSIGNSPFGKKLKGS